MSALSLDGGGFDYVGGLTWGPGWSVGAGDLNGDGPADLFFYHPATGMWSEAFSDGLGGFVYVSGQWDAGWKVAITDFNDDGRGDLMLSRADGTWVRATSAADGAFTYVAGDWGAGWTVYVNK